MNLFEAVDAEIEIWKKTYTHKDLQNGCLFFHEKAYPQHPYWNLLFGPSNESIIKEIPEAKAVAESVGVTGHYLQYTDGIERAGSVLLSSDKYFYRKLTSKKSDWEQNPDIRLCESLNEFSEIVGAAFQFEGEFTKYFCQKLQALAKIVPSKHFSLQENGKTVGTWSLFESKKHNIEFLMNVSINPAFHGQGKSYKLVEAITSTGHLDIVTHTSSTALMEKVFPSLNFIELGTVKFYRM